MGKGTIISGGTDGEYIAQIIYKRDTYTTAIASLTAIIAMLTDQIAASEPGSVQDVLKSQKLSSEKRKNYLETNMPADENITVWCVDLTEDLTGDVGLIEVPGESVSFNIYPGFTSAVYSQARDGQLMPTVVQTPEQAYYNLAMLPGWQKWKPTFRYATISNLTGDSCTVTFEGTTSTQQSLSINQTASIDSVTIDYMDCDGIAFKEGDSVLVMFGNQDWSQPKVIGFKDNPKPCRDYLLYRTYDLEYGVDECMVYDLLTQAVAIDIPDGSGGFVSFPCEYSDLSAWLSATTVVTSGVSAPGGTYRSSIIYESLPGGVSDTETWTDTLSVGGEAFNNSKTDYQLYSYDPDALESSVTWSFDCISGLGVFDAHIKLAYHGSQAYERENDYDLGDTSCSLFASLDQSAGMTMSSSASSVNHHTDFYESLYESSWSKASGSWVHSLTTCEYSAEFIRSLTPYFYLSYLRTETFFLLFGTVTSGWAIRDSNGYCNTFCGDPPEPGYTEERQPWMQTFLVDSTYLESGLAESFTPADATSSTVGDLINTFLQGVYAQYRTNGFPPMATTGIPVGGPAWQLTHEVSIRK